MVDATIKLALGPTYPPQLWDLCKHVAAERRLTKGRPERVIFVELSAPITSPVIEVAILSGSLYLIGVRRKGGSWFEFQPDTERSHPGQPVAGPRLKGSRWIMKGNRPALFSYRELGIPDAAKAKERQGYALTYRGQPADLLCAFGEWNGILNTDEQRIRMAMLFFVVCESLRFRSVEHAVARWVRAHVTDKPSDGFVFTSAMIEKVQKWRKAAIDDRDVQIRTPEQPDPLID